MVSLFEPPKFDNPLGSSRRDDRRLLEFVRTESANDKLKALKQYRRAHGLCDRCVEKWSYSHKCASTVQLHVMQELWELMPEDDGLSDAPSITESAVFAIVRSCCYWCGVTQVYEVYGAHTGHGHYGVVRPREFTHIYKLFYCCSIIWSVITFSSYVS
jgi:hypothetical protein